MTLSDESLSVINMPAEADKTSKPVAEALDELFPPPEPPVEPEPEDHKSGQPDEGQYDEAGITEDDSWQQGSPESDESDGQPEAEGGWDQDERVQELEQQLRISEQRNRSLQGQFKSLKDRIAELEGEVSALEKERSALERDAENYRLTSDDYVRKLAKERGLTDDEIEENGVDVLRTHFKMSRPHALPVERKTAAGRQGEELPTDPGASRASARKRAVIVALDTSVPQWRQMQGTQDFAAWAHTPINTPEGLSYTPQDAIEQALEEGDADTVVAVYESYRRAAQRRNSRMKNGSAAEPRARRGGGALQPRRGQNATNKPGGVWKLSELRKLEEKIATGKITGDEKKKLNEEIDAVYREGRIEDDLGKVHDWG